MAAAAAAPADEAKPKKGPGLVIQLVVLLVLTAATAGAGWFFGGMLGASVQPPPAEEAASADHAPADAHGAPEGGHGEGGGAPVRVYPLEPITTNLADPTEIWVRLELALVFADVPDPELAETVHQDILAYMRTVKARQIERPSGFQHLRSDLDERARVRSDGKVKQVLIRTMLFE
jgi:flagellar FliL protein